MKYWRPTTSPSTKTKPSNVLPWKAFQERSERCGGLRSGSTRDFLLPALGSTPKPPHRSGPRQGIESSAPARPSGTPPPPQSGSARSQPRRPLPPKPASPGDTLACSGPTHHVITPEYPFVIQATLSIPLLDPEGVNLWLQGCGVNVIWQHKCE